MAKSKKTASSATSDVSNKAIIVALVLVVLVSVVSLGVYMRSLDRIDPDRLSAVSGEVEFTVMENPTLREHQTDSDSAQVSLAVARPSN